MLSSISLLKLREDIRNLMLIIFMLRKGCQTKLLSDYRSGPISCDSKVYVYLITENNRYVFQIIQGTGTRANSEIFQKGLRRKFWENVMSYFFQNWTNEHTAFSFSFGSFFCFIFVTLFIFEIPFLRLFFICLMWKKYLKITKFQNSTPVTLGYLFYLHLNPSARQLPCNEWKLATYIEISSCYLDKAS